MEQFWFDGTEHEKHYQAKKSMKNRNKASVPAAETPRKEYQVLMSEQIVKS